MSRTANRFDFDPRALEDRKAKTIKDSPADKWYNCAINDKRMKLGTNVEHMKRNIFRYRAISDWSRDQYGGCILKRAWSSP